MAEAHRWAGYAVVLSMLMGLLLVVVLFCVLLASAHRNVIAHDPRCETAARYDAMRDAYAAGRPDPCNGAKEWVR